VWELVGAVGSAAARRAAGGPTGPAKDLHLGMRSLAYSAGVLAELREAIDGWIELGVPLDRIESEVVEAAPLDEERRAALWLYAWHRTESA
jgi:hypothetical protein